MKCFGHPDKPAIAICAHCGKGMCADCARTSATGRQICSAACAATQSSYIINGYVLFCLGAVLLSAAALFVSQGLWQGSLFLGFVAVLCFRKGSRPERETASQFDLYYRTGDALEKTHLYRQRLSEFLSAHAGHFPRAITLSQLETADQSDRINLLAEVFTAVGEKVGKEFFPLGSGATAKQHADALGFCQSLATDFFTAHQKPARSISGRQRLTGQLFRAHLPLREHIPWLSRVTKRLKDQCLQEGGQ